MGDSRSDSFSMDTETFKTLANADLFQEAIPDFRLPALEAAARSFEELAIAQTVRHPSHFAIEGTWEGYSFVLFYGKKALLRVGGEPFTTPLYEATTAVLSSPSTLTQTEWESLIEALFGGLEKAPFFYSFTGKKAHLLKSDGEYRVETTNEPEIYRAWGYTSEEAVWQIKQPSKLLADEGIGVELQVELWKAIELVEEPLEKDERDFSPALPSLRRRGL